METNELKATKKEYEGRISSVISVVLEKFRQETGIAVTGCFINIDTLRNADDEIKTSIYGVNMCLDI